MARRTKTLDVRYNGHDFYYKRSKKPKRGSVIEGRYVLPIKSYNIAKRNKVFRNISNKYRKRVNRIKNVKRFGLRPRN